MKSRVFAIAMAIMLGASVAMAAPQGQNDQWGDQLQISKKVTKSILMMPYYGVFDAISFDVQGSTVYLTGQVRNASLKSTAEKRIQKIDGVSQVVNNIEVLPISSYDDGIRRQVLRNMYRTGSLYRYFQGTNPAIRIIVDGGHVSLEGFVSNKTDAILARNAALQVPGVFEVNNNLNMTDAN